MLSISHFIKTKGLDYTIYEYHSGLFFYEAIFVDGNKKGGLVRRNKSRNEFATFFEKYRKHEGWVNGYNYADDTSYMRFTMDEMCAIIMLDQV